MATNEELERRVAQLERQVRDLLASQPPLAVRSLDRLNEGPITSTPNPFGW